MFNKLRLSISYVLIIAVLFTVQLTANPAIASAQDRAIHYQLRFRAGTSSASLAKRVVRGTSHIYHFRARKGQYATVILDAGENTSFSIYSAQAGQVDGADGVHDWDGNLLASGEYIIEIGTDVSANYILNVSIK